MLVELGFKLTTPGFTVSITTGASHELKNKQEIFVKHYAPPERHDVRNIFDPMTSKPIGVIYRSPAASMSSLRAMGAGNVELSLGQAFRVQGHCDLDL